jgi:hypothetical protein
MFIVIIYHPQLKPVSYEIWIIAISYDDLEIALGEEGPT